MLVSVPSLLMTVPHWNPTRNYFWGPQVKPNYFCFYNQARNPGASLGQTGSAFQTGIAFVVANPVQKRDAPAYFGKVSNIKVVLQDKPSRNLVSGCPWDHRKSKFCHRLPNVFGSKFYLLPFGWRRQNFDFRWSHGQTETRSRLGLLFRTTFIFKLFQKNEVHHFLDRVSYNC